MRIGVLEAKSQKDLGIAGIIAAVLVIKGATWAFGVGIVMCALLYGKHFFHNGGEENAPDLFNKKK